jgi:hypothetical protein
VPLAGAFFVNIANAFRIWLFLAAVWRQYSFAVSGQVTTMRRLSPISASNDPQLKAAGLPSANYFLAPGAMSDSSIAATQHSEG